MDISEPINLRITSTVLPQSPGKEDLHEDVIEQVESHSSTCYPLLRESMQNISTALVRINW